MFSLSVSNSSSDFGRFGDPLGLARTDFVSYVDQVDSANISVTGTGVAIPGVADGFKESRTTSSKASGTTTSINTWGKIDAFGYDISIVTYDIRVGIRTDLVSSSGNSISHTQSSSSATPGGTIALRLTYDLTNESTLGFIGMVANQNIVEKIDVIVNGTASDSSLSSRNTTTNYIIGGKKLMYTGALDIAYDLKKTPIGGNAFGQIAISYLRYGGFVSDSFEQKDNAVYGLFEGIAMAFGVKDINILGIKLTATISYTTEGFLATNSSASHSSNGGNSGWSNTYIPSDYVASAANNSRYYIPYDSTRSLSIPNSFVFVVRASGSWTLLNKAVLELSALNGLNMYAKPLADIATGKSTSFINNLFHVANSYYIFGVDDKGVELSKNSKDVIKAGIYFDPRFVDHVNGHINESFNFASRLYVGADFKSLGLQVDADIRYINQIRNVMELAFWAKYTTSIDGLDNSPNTGIVFTNSGLQVDFDVRFLDSTGNTLKLALWSKFTTSINGLSNLPTISTTIAFGYRYTDNYGLHTKSGVDYKYDAFHHLYGYIGGSTKLEGGVNIELFDAIKIVVGNNLRADRGSYATGVTYTVVEQRQVINSLRLVVSKDLTNVISLSAGITNLTWYNDDRDVYFSSGRDLSATDAAFAKNNNYLNNETYLNATLTVKMNSSSTLKITYGITGLVNGDSFSSGKAWNSGTGLSTNSSSGNQAAVKTLSASGSSSETFTIYVLRKMPWDKFSIELTFNF